MKKKANRQRVRKLGATARADTFLATRRAAVSAWRKAAREFERLRVRIEAELDRARERLESIDASVVELDGVAAMDLSLATPLEMLEQLRDEIDGVDYPTNLDEQIANAKGAKRP
jgi:hypothetical protein